jgi:hypothetical protein
VFSGVREGRACHSGCQSDQFQSIRPRRSCQEEATSSEIEERGRAGGRCIIASGIFPWHARGATVVAAVLLLGRCSDVREGGDSAGRASAPTLTIDVVVTGRRRRHSARGRSMAEEVRVAVL